MLVCADVIEHLVDPTGLLLAIRALLEHAPVALLSTPERVLVRGAHDQGPPANAAHVREWAPWEGVTMRDALHHVRELGFNAVDHTVLVFHPVDAAAFAPGDELRERLRHFEFGTRAGHFLQVKAWDARAAGRVDLAQDGGHTARFEGRRVFPFKFLLLHYPVRSQAYGERKVFGERRSRWNAEERGRGWHHQYDAMAAGHAFTRDAAELETYDAAFDRRFLVERLSGIGIARS